MAADPYPHGEIHIEEMAQSRIHGRPRGIPNGSGYPPGGLCSPVLANLTLDRLERTLRELYPTNTPRAKRAKVNLVRYADDFIITGSSKELLEQVVMPLVKTFMEERGLQLSQEKTHITH